MNIPIQKKYFDILAFSTSPINRKKTYFIGYPELLVLQKLIHYDSSNKNITYTNKEIGKHLFRKERDIENIITRLKKKGFICTESATIVNGHNSINKKRTINIIWDFFQSILDEIEADVKLTTQELPAQIKQPVNAPSFSGDVFNHIIDMVIEIGKIYKCDDMNFANKIIDEYNGFMNEGKLNDNNFNPAKVRNHISKRFDAKRLQTSI